jgi:hypothetical protein
MAMVITLFNAGSASLALEAFEWDGKRLHSQARLNPGNCTSYALANVLNASLLHNYKRADFAAKDIPAATIKPSKVPMPTLLRVLKVASLGVFSKFPRAGRHPQNPQKLKDRTNQGRLLKVLKAPYLGTFRKNSRPPYPHGASQLTHGSRARIRTWPR